MDVYRWAAADQFLGRGDDLARLQKWWENPQALPINLFGRRRIGKSWLFRKFADGKPAVILVAEQNTPAQQFARIADQIKPFLPFRPSIDDIAGLFTVLYQLGREGKVLVVVDEFPYLLGSTPKEQHAALSAVQAVMERFRDDSKVKLIVCGSALAQMETLQEERNPLHGRLQAYRVGPLEFSDARLFMPDLAPIDQLTRYSITGGSPRYLTAICRGSLASTLAEELADRNSPLFNEPLALLQSELREPGTYLGVLAAMAHNPADSAELSRQTGLDAQPLSFYLDKLASLGFVGKRRPAGAAEKSRSTQYACTDGFLRFWFRFIQPYQAGLEAGADPVEHIKQHVLGELADHTSGTFEELFRRWIRQTSPAAGEVGAWWGPALHRERRAKTRFTEEIDSVGVKGKNVVVAGEAKWTSRVLPYDVLKDLREFKLPAMQQAGFNVSDRVPLVLVSRAGFSKQVQEAANGDSPIRLVEAATLLQQVR